MNNTNTLELNKNDIDAHQITEEVVSRSELLSMINRESAYQVSSSTANEILGLLRKDKTESQNRRDLINPLELAKEMTQNWYTCVAKYYGKIPYEQGDDKWEIYCDAMRLSNSLGFEKFDGGQKAPLNKPFVLDKPILEKHNRMSSIFKSKRNQEFKDVEERFLNIIEPLVNAFNNSDEIEIKFKYKYVSSKTLDPRMEDHGWIPLSYSTDVGKKVINKKDFLENCKRGFIKVQYQGIEYVESITLNMVDSVIS